MPISVECPECGATRRVADHLEGKAIRCKACNGRIPVRRTVSQKLPTKSGKSKKSKKKASSSNAGLLLGSGAAVALVLIGLGVFMAMQTGDPPAAEPAQAVNENGSNAVDPATDNSVATTPEETNNNASNPKMAANTPPSGFQTPDTSTAPSTPQTASGFQKTPEKPADELTFSVSADWSLMPDTPTGESSFKETKPFRVKLDKNKLRGDGVVFPYGPSKFVGVSIGSGNSHHHEIRDASTGLKVSDAYLSGFISTMALAADGSYFAGAGAEDIEVIDLNSKKSLGKLSTATSGKFNVSQLGIWNDKVVAVSNVHKGIKVWQLPSGTLLHDIKGEKNFNPEYGHAFSPGGKYFAVDGDFLEKRIDIYDLESGKVVGSITPGGTIRVNELEALGFSRDGTQFSALYGVSFSSRKYSRMLTWHLSTGEVAHDFEIEPLIKDQLSPVYKSRELDCLPGGTRWLAHSLGIIDVEEQKMIYGFPKQDGVDLIPSRKVMGDDWVIAAVTDEGDPQLKSITFTQEDLIAGAQSAAAGGIPSDLKLPMLTASEMSQAADGIASNEWKVQPDSLQASPIKDSIKIETTGNVREVVISRSESPVVVVRSGIDEDIKDSRSSGYNLTNNSLESKGMQSASYGFEQPVAKEIELTAFDASGTQKAQLRIPFSAKLHSVSPAGEFAVIEEHRTNGRLDIYEIKDDGQHIVGWRPFRAEADKNHREIKKAEFINEQYVATISKNNLFCVWEVPSLNAIWKLDEVLDLEISPGGKTLAVVRGNILGSKSLDFFNAYNGEGLGKIEMNGHLKSLAFHPEGTELALSIEKGANKVISFVDVASGDLLEEIPVPFNATTLSWTSNDYLLLNGQSLLSRPLQSLIWSYKADDIILPRYQVNTDFGFMQVIGKRSLIRTVSVPNEKTELKFKPDQLTTLAILNPGDSVTLVVSTAGDELPDTLQDSATEALKKQLQAADSQVTDGANISLAVNISSKSDGTVDLTKIGDRTVSETVTKKYVTIDLSYSHQGKEIWKSTRRIGNLDRFLVHLKNGQSAQQTIDEQMIEGVKSNLDTMKLPRFIFKPEAGQGLGSSSFYE